jgi:hypothetical protein
MRVKKADYIESYKIKILFSDGVEKVVDFAPFLKEAKHVFLPLRNTDYFKKFQIDEITLSWPNGADFDPELLYEMGTLIKKRPIKNKIHRRTLTPARIGKKSSVKK